MASKGILENRARKAKKDNMCGNYEGVGIRKTTEIRLCVRVERSGNRDCCGKGCKCGKLRSVFSMISVCFRLACFELKDNLWLCTKK